MSFWTSLIFFMLGFQAFSFLCRFVLSYHQLPKFNVSLSGSSLLIPIAIFVLFSQLVIFDPALEQDVFLYAGAFSWLTLAFLSKRPGITK